jgi:hypothetical protein
MALGAYLLSLGTALACAALLTRAFRTTGVRLLFWSALCFWLLTAANAVAVVDVFVVPNVNLYWIRLVAGLSATLVLLYGLVWESQ